MMLTPLEATQTSATHYDTKLIEDFISELLFRTMLDHTAGNAADPSTSNPVKKFATELTPFPSLKHAIIEIIIRGFIDMR
eukprot:scaffold3700_cov84-Skeletonema_marinoi.AAC.5